jgi:hypothetical protein
VRQRRMPAFVGSEASDQVSFGQRTHYIWGNICAMDCFRNDANEGDAAKNSDLTFGFVGDYLCVLAPDELF